MAMLQGLSICTPGNLPFIHTCTPTKVFLEHLLCTGIAVGTKDAALNKKGQICPSWSWPSKGRNKGKTISNLVKWGWHGWWEWWDGCGKGRWFRQGGPERPLDGEMLEGRTQWSSHRERGAFPGREQQGRRGRNWGGGSWWEWHAAGPGGWWWVPCRDHTCPSSTKTELKVSCLPSESFKGTRRAWNCSSFTNKASPSVLAQKHQGRESWRAAESSNATAACQGLN